MKITKKTKISKVLENSKNAAPILIQSGMHCLGCPMAMEETIEDGLRAHGMDDKEIEEVVKKLNR
jgi:hybrid cluster-associated redox disulfide protein